MLFFCLTLKFIPITIQASCVGVALVLWDLATLLKGLRLIVLLWVRRDTAPDQGERIFSLAVLCTNCTADDFFFMSFWEASAVDSVQRFGCTE